MANKWKGLDTDNFSFVDLGRPAVFLLPLAKIIVLEYDGKTIEQTLHTFLVKEFSAFTFSTISNFGVWINGKQMIVHDECRLYEVSFVGKEKISILGDMLAKIALLICEECIYFKAGQYASLIYPEEK